MKYIAYVCLIIFLFSSCSSKQEKIKPTVESITESVYASGIIKAKNQYKVYPTITGIISRIFVTENDTVKIGSPLMFISDETSFLNRENASLAANYASVNTNTEKLTDLKNAINLSTSKFQNDSLLLIRQQILWKQNIGSKLDLEQKELAYQNSKTALESAKIKYHDLVKQLEFNAAQSNNSLKISKSKENDYTIKSEIEGKVYALPLKKGEMVNPQTPVAILGDAKDFLMELQVDEYDIVKIKPGQKVIITMDSYKGLVFEGRITKINPLMNERNKSFIAEAEFINEPKELYPNLTLEANIVIQTKLNALTIPRNYLLNDSIVILNKDQQKVVRTGLKDYKKVEIISGLNADDYIYKPQQ